jgi:restriction endonuclease S subunit
MAQAEETKDTKAVEALVSKAEALAQQMGPEYIKLVEGLELIDPKSVEAEKFVAILSALDDKCN